MSPTPPPPPRLLEDKVLIVTGSSSGIGRAVAIAAANHGAKVVLHHLGPSTQADIDSLVSSLPPSTQHTTVAGDIALPDTATAIVNAAISSFGRIDVLVSNAGICPFHSFLDLPHTLWKRVQDVNLNGAFYAVQAVANAMAAQTPRGGSIVAISSISALMGGAEQTHYTPTKAGVKSLMESCAIALGGLGIRCNSVLPGTIETPINADDLADPVKREYMTRRIPLGRLGEPDDIAQPVIFFASDMAKYCTGASLLVDGGAAISLQ
ncbi:L-rhamnose-1-dehydrogenase [Vanrija pseudolonga]|uniref:L-rhamnose-1-dehydrogenase n=1 Tax=Vanrija pseudolonga TaxID=143232 RepID=A0AAF1BKB8_9TREE|nr:L-rhamnose-1-dehydrogenase [Vanrija pseudolonga]